MENMCNCGCGMPTKVCEGGGSKEINYMFFGNLETIKRIVDELLEMDPNQIDEVLSDGHEWAVDHIASSVDDIQEVYNFLKNRVESSANRRDAFAEDSGFVKTFESYVNSISINESKESLEREARNILSRLGYRMTELKQDTAKDLARILRQESKERSGKEKWDDLADKLEK